MDSGPRRIYFPDFNSTDQDKRRLLLEQCHSEVVKLFPDSFKHDEVIQYKILQKLTTSENDVLSTRISALIDLKTGTVIRATKGQRQEAP